jgi:hypothetical protein
MVLLTKLFPYDSKHVRTIHKTQVHHRLITTAYIVDWSAPLNVVNKEIHFKLFFNYQNQKNIAMTKTLSKSIEALDTPE